MHQDNSPATGAGTGAGTSLDDGTGWGNRGEKEEEKEEEGLWGVEEASVAGQVLLLPGRCSGGGSGGSAIIFVAAPLCGGGEVEEVLQIVSWETSEAMAMALRVMDDEGVGVLGRMRELGRQKL
jgi:hypothetical protein